jgi:metal-dependent amidase/aminoacylase/carboxypeptidase family protein
VITALQSIIMDGIAGCYFFVGAKDSDRGLNASHHEPCFDINEQAMPHGAALMAATVIDLLQA